MMKGRQSHNPDDVPAFLVDSWSDLDLNILLLLDEGWIARLEEVIATNGEYDSEWGI
jgi:hypothetical protein